MVDQRVAPRSARRYKPITDLLPRKEEPIVKRRSREVSTSADIQVVQRSRRSPHADVMEQEEVQQEMEYREARSHYSLPAHQSPRTTGSATYQGDARESLPGDAVFDDEENRERVRQDSYPQSPRRCRQQIPSAVLRKPGIQASRRRKSGWRILAVILAILIALFILGFGVYSFAWYCHAQSVQNTVSTRFASHAPVDTLVLAGQVVVARNDGDAISIYFVPANGGQGTRLVQALPQHEWGTPSLVIPSLFLKKGTLYLQLTGVPTFPNWAQPEATYRLQSTAEGYQAIQMV